MDSLFSGSERIPWIEYASVHLVMNISGCDIALPAVSVERIVAPLKLEAENRE